MSCAVGLGEENKADSLARAPDWLRDKDPNKFNNLDEPFARQSQPPNTKDKKKLWQWRRPLDGKAAIKETLQRKTSVMSFLILRKLALKVDFREGLGKLVPKRWQMHRDDFADLRRIAQLMSLLASYQSLMRCFHGMTGSPWRVGLRR